MKIKNFLLLSLAIPLSACALMTRDELQKQDEEKKQMKDQVTHIQRSKADDDLKYNDVMADQRSLNGRMDAIDHNHEVSASSVKQELDKLRSLIDQQNEKIKMVQEHIDATEIRLTAAIQAASGGMAIPASPASVKSSVPVSATGGIPVTAQIDPVPAGPLAEAETLFRAKDYKKSIVAFQAYIDKNPKGKSLPESTYKIGVCFGELGFKKDAKEFYKDVIDNYPSSSWAKKAKYRLTNLK